MATSYANPGGTGDRTATVFVVATGGTSAGPILVNGNLSETTFFWAGAGSNTVEFWFPSKKIIDEAKFYQSSAATHGTWKWQGSNDRTTWTDIGSTFTLGGSTTQTITTLTGNVTGYIFYRLFQTAGTTNSGPWIYEFEFKIDDAGSSTTYLHSLGSGNRTGLITTSFNNITWSGTGAASGAATLINGAWSNELFWPGIAASGTWIAFDFGASYVVQQARFRLNGANSQGNWKFQGSTDGSSWTDLSGEIVLGSALVTCFGGFESNTTAYRHYRFLGVSGTRSDVPFEQEVEFMVGAPTSSGITLVSSVNVALGNTGGTTSSIDTTGTNLIAISVATSTNPPYTVSDSKGNTYTALTLSNTGTVYQRLFYVLSPTVGSGHTFTITGSGILSAISVYAFSGVNGGYSGLEGVTIGSTSPLNTTSVTPLTNGALILTGISSNGAVVASAPSGFTGFVNIAVSGSNRQLSSAYLIQTTAATIVPQWAWTGTFNVASAIAVFYPTSTAAGRISQLPVEAAILSDTPIQARLSQLAVEVLVLETGLSTTGLTAHYDASNSDDLFTTFVSGGPHTGTPTDGSSVYVWDHEEGANRIFKQSGANAVPVWRSTTPLLPLPCLDFTGGQRLILTNNTGTNLVLSDIITNTAYTILIAFYAETVTHQTDVSYNGHPLIGETSGYFGIFLHLDNAASTPKVSVFNWDVNADYIKHTLTIGAPHVIMARHQGGTLYSSLDGGAESSIAAGNTGTMTGNVLMGAGTYQFQSPLDARIGEIAIYNTALTGTNLSNAISYFTDKWLAVAPPASAETTQFLIIMP